MQRPHCTAGLGRASARPFSRRAKQRWGKQRVTSVGCTRNTAWRSHSAPQHGRVGLHHRTRVPRNEWLPSSAGRVPFCAILCHSQHPPCLPRAAVCPGSPRAICVCEQTQAQSTTVNHDRPWPISSPVSVFVSVSCLCLPVCRARWRPERLSLERASHLMAAAGADCTLRMHRHVPVLRAKVWYDSCNL